MFAADYADLASLRKVHRYKAINFSKKFLRILPPLAANSAWTDTLKTVNKPVDYIP
jgi:hypothetical protein